MEAKVTTHGNFIKFLEGLPDTNTRLFEEKITKKLTEEDILDTSELEDIINDSKIELEIRFKAFFGLSLHHRRNSNYSSYKMVVDKYIDYFREFPVHFHILSLLYKFLGTTDDLKLSIFYAREAVALLPNHVGVLHNYCESVVAALEDDIRIETSHITEARVFIDKVIALSPNYAKFYCTQGRILAQEGQFEAARKSIYKAIDTENSKSIDYMMRISDYKNYLSMVKSLELFKKVEKAVSNVEDTLNKATVEINQRTEKTTGMLEEMKVQNLQVLGFFVAIISFVLGSINLLGDKTFKEASMLILILNGTMIIAYVSFSILLSKVNQSYGKMILVSGIGILLMIIGFVTYKYL
ncbi:hypothetical protein [Bacillus sp. AK128]